MFSACSIGSHYGFKALDPVDREAPRAIGAYEWLVSSLVTPAGGEVLSDTSHGHHHHSHPHHSGHRGHHGHRHADGGNEGVRWDLAASGAG